MKTITLTSAFVAQIEAAKVTWLTQRISKFGYTHDFHGGDVFVPMTPKQQSRLLALVTTWRYDYHQSTERGQIAADQHHYLLRAGVTF